MDEVEYVRRRLRNAQDLAVSRRTQVNQLKAKLDEALVENKRLRTQLSVWNETQDRIERVLALHREWGIYDECDCTDEQKGDGQHIEIEDIGLTCNKVAVGCSHCCAEGGYMTQHCADLHVHDLDPSHRCPTVEALTGGESDD